MAQSLSSILGLRTVFIGSLSESSKGATKPSRKKPAQKVIITHISILYRSLYRIALGKDQDNSEWLSCIIFMQCDCTLLCRQAESVYGGAARHLKGSKHTHTSSGTTHTHAVYLKSVFPVVVLVMVLETLSSMLSLPSSTTSVQTSITGLGVSTVSCYIWCMFVL